MFEATVLLLLLFDNIILMDKKSVILFTSSVAIQVIELKCACARVSVRASVLVCHSACVYLRVFARVYAYVNV